MCAGVTWQWPKGGGTQDGFNMTECSLAVLPNNTMVLNARDYMGQKTHTVHRATMWSPDEGAVISCTHQHSLLQTSISRSLHNTGYAMLLSCPPALSRPNMLV